MRNWERPMVVVDTFAANEFVSSCGDSGVVYKFKCDAGDEWGGYSVYLNGKDGIAHTKDDIFWCGGRGAVKGNRTYGRCGETHSAEDKNDFFPGYIRKTHLFGGVEEKKVIVWTDNGTNVHCTTNLNKSTWETEKS